MKTAAVIVALVVALALQTTLAGLRVGSTTAVNLVLVAVVYVALAFGPGGGLLAGTVGGLIQDALAGGIVGIGGLSKTLVGFLVGVPRRAVHRLAAAAAVRDVRRRDGAARGLLPGAVRAGRGAAVSAGLFGGAHAGGRQRAVGVIAFLLVERGPEMLQRRRARGASLTKHSEVLEFEVPVQV